MSDSAASGTIRLRESVSLPKRPANSLWPNAARRRKASVVKQHALNRPLEPDALEDCKPEIRATGAGFSGLDFSFNFDRGRESDVRRDHRGLLWLHRGLGPF